MLRASATSATSSRVLTTIGAALGDTTSSPRGVSRMSATAAGRRSVGHLLGLAGERPQRPGDRAADPPGDQHGGHDTAASAAPRYQRRRSVGLRLEVGGSALEHVDDLVAELPGSRRRHPSGVVASSAAGSTAPPLGDRRRRRNGTRPCHLRVGQQAVGGGGVVAGALGLHDRVVLLDVAARAWRSRPPRPARRCRRGPCRRRAAGPPAGPPRRWRATR